VLEQKLNSLISRFRDITSLIKSISKNSIVTHDVVWYIFYLLKLGKYTIMIRNLAETESLPLQNPTVHTIFTKSNIEQSLLNTFRPFEPRNRN